MYDVRETTALKRVPNLSNYLLSIDTQKGFISYTMVNFERSPLSNIFSALSWLLSTCVRLLGLEKFSPKTKAFTWILHCNILLQESYSVCSLWLASKLATDKLTNCDCSQKRSIWGLREGRQATTRRLVYKHTTRYVNVTNLNTTIIGGVETPHRGTEVPN